MLQSNVGYMSFIDGYWIWLEMAVNFFQFDMWDVLFYTDFASALV